jgi:hypothetical protein
MQITSNAGKTELHQHINQLFNRPDAMANTASKLGNKLQAAEAEYIRAVSNPNASPGEIAKAEIIYKRAVQVFQSFMQITAAMFDILRQALSRLSLR